MFADSQGISSIAFISLGLLALGVYTARLAWFASASRRWPTTRGRMLFSGLHSARGSAHTYVHYTYVVDGVTYESKRLRFGLFPSPGYDMALSRLSALQGKGSLLVYYDPRKPSRSCLLTGVNELTFMLPFLLLVLSMLFMAADIFVASSNGP